ncbi:pre-mRNA-splicing factor PRP46 [Puccinia striiformis f. sp. tritici PST-78]|uniref:Pre-mRNA-splicing factor PRP46 n=1 Tax=Puccinia striiformis f. sp. tritici PST-78 TaxID=1165861 RepID=A0A0L0VT57_9BASI|nr:pre-mRNA-splicing factor PRP46 [Puccinia striiformis f. sp. tritici PST-78]
MATSSIAGIDRSLKRTHALFGSNKPTDFHDVERNLRMRVVTKVYDEYRDCKTLPSAVLDQQAGVSGPSKPSQPKSITAGPLRIQAGASDSTQLVQTDQHAAHQPSTLLSKSLIRRKEARSVKPDFHPQWKLHRVISGHLGWVRSAAVEPGNQWFVTGAGDRIIKVWDLASGNLKLSLTGHISTVRGLAVSDRHPYLFSCGEDKMVKCWDLEQNKVIRHYHGHLSGVYSLSLHPTLDVLVTAGRDASARVWDMRTKAQVHVLSGHTATIADVKCQESDPQVITGSMDSTIRLWDLAAGRTMAQLTHHHKSVRSLTIHPTEYSFASGSSGGNNIKKWKCPEGMFVHNFSGHDAIINTVCVNEEGVMYSGADNGSMTWWDYKTGLPFQTMSDIPQPGSLDAEAGVFCSTFDATGTRLITGCADKTIKIYREVLN